MTLIRVASSEFGKSKLSVKSISEDSTRFIRKSRDLDVCIMIPKINIRDLLPYISKTSKSTAIENRDSLRKK